MQKTCSMNPLKQKMTMKKNSFLWAALSMTAALVMTACSSDDNDMTEAPVAPSTSKTIPYTVTVGGDEATTRATVDGNNKTLRFATGDKLYITGTNIKGVLDLQDGGAGETSNVTFSGNLEYTGEGSPADGLSLTATLVSAQQTVGTQVSVNAAGAVTVNYPTTAYCSSINDAVQKYSNLTGTSTYGARAFTLTQQTAFLNFVITFEDATTTGTELTAVVNNNSSNICSASVTTETVSENVVAKFVLPVAAGTTLSSAKVTMGSKAAISFGASQKLTGKVYNVEKTQAAPALNLTSPAVGQVIGNDGKNYNYASLPSGVTAVAKICYVSGSDVLALALADETGTMYWSTAISTCAAHTPAFTGGTWLLASRDQWEKMGAIQGSQTYTALRDGFEGVGGTNMQSVGYWSSTEASSSYAYYYYFGNSNWGYTGKDSERFRVRACLAFYAPKAAAEATAEDKGKLIGTDGKIYATKAAATAAGTTAVAKIIYIGTTGHATYSHGLALALTDESSSTMYWQDAINACSAKNTSTRVTNATWLLASKEQWEKMGAIQSSQTYTALRDGFSSVGGSNMRSSGYWSSTEAGSSYAYYYYFGNSNWGYTGKNSESFYVRACLAF